MNLIISNNSEIPIYEQIKREIKRAINTNELNLQRHYHQLEI
ncbi:MAG: hypothetical protein OSJ63_08085 [Bacilli bacterium]|nr:hypothetical protein [Bacilli bacterium]